MNWVSIRRAVVPAADGYVLVEAKENDNGSWTFRVFFDDDEEDSDIFYERDFPTFEEGVKDVEESLEEVFNAVSDSETVTTKH